MKINKNDKKNNLNMSSITTIQPPKSDDNKIVIVPTIESTHLKDDEYTEKEIMKVDIFGDEDTPIETIGQRIRKIR